MWLTCRIRRKPSSSLKRLPPPLPSKNSRFIAVAPDLFWRQEPGVDWFDVHARPATYSCAKPETLRATPLHEPLNLRQRDGVIRSTRLKARVNAAWSQNPER